MRALARHLGVGASTLYYHVESLEELQALVAERLLERFRLELPEPKEWRQGVVRAAYALRAVFESQPGLADSALHDPRWGEVTIRVNEEACRFMSRAGFPAAKAWLATRAVADFVEAYVVRARAHREVGQTDLDNAFQALEACPSMEAAAEALKGAEQEQRFSFGLDCLVRGLSAVLQEERR